MPDDPDNPPNAPPKLPAWCVLIGVIAGIALAVLMNETQGFSLENIFQALFAGGIVAHICGKVAEWFQL